MKIAMLVRHHSFRDVRIFEKEAKSLSKMGHKVIIVAGRRAGKLFGLNGDPVQKKMFQNNEFVFEGIPFITFETRYPYRGQTEQRSLNRLMIQNILKHTHDFFQDSLYQKALSLEADVYIAHTLDVLYEAIQIKRALRKRGKIVKVVFDAKELENKSRFMDVMMPEVDHLITVSKRIAFIYRKRYPGTPVTIIYNSPFFDEKLPAKNFNAKQLIIAHEGELTLMKGNPQRIVNLMTLLKKAKVNSRFKIIGGFYRGVTKFPKYRRLLRELRTHSGIDIVGWLDYKGLPNFYKKVHLGYINFDLSQLNRLYALPNKFFSYLSNGIPVIVNASSEMSRIVRIHRCGIVINKKYATSKDYAIQVARLYRNRSLLRRMSNNARKAMKRIYSWQIMEKRLQAIMDSFGGGYTKDTENANPPWMAKAGGLPSVSGERREGKVKICMMVRSHSFKDVRIFEKQAKSFAGFGYDISIIAGKRNGKLFELDGKPVSETKYDQAQFSYDGVPFKTYDALYPFPTPEEKTQMEARMIGELQNGLTQYFPDGLYHTALAEHADIYVAHELDMLYEAVQIKRTLASQGYKVKVIWDAKELESRTPFMDTVMQEVDHIFTVSEGLESFYKSWYPSVPITLIYNSPKYIETVYEKDFNSSPFTLAYEGEITQEKGNPDKILKIVNTCRNIMQFKFKILGGVYFGAEKFQQFRDSVPQLKTHPQVDWQGWVPYNKISEFYQDVHLGYIDFKLNNLNMQHALPNKFFSMLNNGVPIILNKANEMGQFIERHKCGFVVNEDEVSAEGYVNVILALNQNRKMLKQWSNNARQVMKSTYSWDNMEKRMLQVVEKL